MSKDELTDADVTELLRAAEEDQALKDRYYALAQFAERVLAVLCSAREPVLKVSDGAALGRIRRAARELGLLKLKKGAQ